MPIIFFKKDKKHVAYCIFVLNYIAFTSLTSDWRSLTVLTDFSKSSKRPALVDQTKFLQKIKKFTRQKPDGWQYCTGDKYVESHGNNR